MVAALLLVNGLSSLYDLAGDGDSHGVTHHIHVRGLGVSQYCLHKGAHVQHVLLGMVVLRNETRVGSSPSRSVQLVLLVTLRTQVSGQRTEPRLPAHIPVLRSPSEPQIAVAMDEDDWGLDDLLLAAGLASEGSTLEIIPFEAVGGVV